MHLSRLGNEIVYNAIMITRYTMPQDWIRYDTTAILPELMGAKATILALTQIPYQRSWAKELQKIQIKREVAGTSRIEGAEFTDKELDGRYVRRRSSWKPAHRGR